MKTFERPLRATQHCRHYSYEPGRGPLCAQGVDLSGFGASGACMPPDFSRTSLCDKRQDYTDDERATWKAWRDASMERLGRAVQALPAPIPLRTSGKVKCPNCDGQILYARWHRGAELRCSTANCCGAHFSIEAGKDWPAREASR